VLVDTAGVKPKSGTSKDDVGLMLNEEIEHAIQYSHVVCVLIDSVDSFTAADMTLIKNVLDEGRAVVIIANKWDMVEDKYKKKAIKWMEK